MNQLKAVFSRQNLPKIFLLGAVYLLGRMEGEGRFTWGDVAATVWHSAVNIGSAASSSAKNLVGM